jgi:hypothetical protein
MWNRIVNPKTGRKVNVNSKMGKSVLRNYRNLIFKNQTGGNIPLFAIDPDSIAYIRSKLFRSNEVCGIFNRVNIGEHIIELQNDPHEVQVGETDRSRDWCLQPIDKPFIWHTHPAVDRGLRHDGTHRGPAYSFPSVEDILKVIKHKNEMSFIFINQGYWVLYKSGVYPNWDDPGLRIVIEWYNGQLYKNGYQGKHLTAEQINYYVGKLNEKLGPTIGFYIKFVFY